MLRPKAPPNRAEHSQLGVLGHNGLSHGRAATYGFAALAIGLAIAAFKWFLGK